MWGRVSSVFVLHRTLRGSSDTCGHTGCLVSTHTSRAPVGRTGRCDVFPCPGVAGGRGTDPPAEDGLESHVSTCASVCLCVRDGLPVTRFGETVEYFKIK